MRDRTKAGFAAGPPVGSLVPWGQMAWDNAGPCRNAGPDVQAIIGPVRDRRVLAVLVMMGHHRMVAAVGSCHLACRCVPFEAGAGVLRLG